jgi:hypothetical protein
MDQNLKQLVTTVGDVAKLVSDLTGGFSFSEFGELIAVGEDFKRLLPQVPKLAAEYLNLTDAERTELVALVTATVKFPANVDVQNAIQKVLDVAISLSSLFQMVHGVPPQAPVAA